MTAKTENTTFAVYLGLEEETGTWCVRSIDVSHTGVLHKITYPDRPAIDEILVGAVSKEVLSQLQVMDLEGEMLANSDYELELTGVRFNKLRVHTTFNTRGHEATFWFGRYVGQPLMALRQYADAVGLPPQMDHVNNLAIQAIDRVIIPALNIVASVRSGVRSTQNVQVFEDYTGRLMQEADDLIMYAELVKRLIVTQKSPGNDAGALDEFGETAKRLGIAR